MNKLSHILSSALIVLGVLLLLQSDLLIAQSGAEKQSFTIEEDSQTAWLGVMIVDFNRKMRKELNTEARYGAVIRHVLDGSPADKAGIEASDVIVRFDGQKIYRAKDLTSRLNEKSPDEKAEIEFFRGKEKVKKEIELGPRPGKVDSYLGRKEDWLHQFLPAGVYLGVLFQEMDDDLAAYFKVDSDAGLLIIEVEEESPAAEAGLKSGDVLAEIAGEKPQDEDDIMEILRDYKEDDEVDVVYYRMGKKNEVTIKLDERSNRWHMPDFKKKVKVIIPSYEFHKSPEFDRELKYQLEEKMEDMNEKMKEWNILYKEDIKGLIEREIDNSLLKNKDELEELKEEIENLKSELYELKEKGL